MPESDLRELKEFENYIAQLEEALRAWLDCETKIPPRIAALRKTVATKIPEIQERSARLREVPGRPLFSEINAAQVSRLIAQTPEQIQIEELEREFEAPRKKIREVHSAMQPCLDRFRCPELRDTFEVLDGILPWFSPAAARRWIGLLKNILRSCSSPGTRRQLSPGPDNESGEGLGDPSVDTVLDGRPRTSYRKAKGIGGRSQGDLVDGAKLRNYRGEYTQEDFAEKCEVSLATIQRGEAGHRWDDTTFQKVAETISTVSGSKVTASDLKNLKK